MQKVKFISLRSVEKRNGCSWYDKKFFKFNKYINYSLHKRLSPAYFLAFFAIV